MEEQEEYEQNEENNISLNNNRKSNTEQINIDLVKRIELLDNENAELKEALAVFQEDINEKESSIEECHKIISKLKDEYSKLVKEY